MPTTPPDPCLMRLHVGPMSASEFKTCRSDAVDGYPLAVLFAKYFTASKQRADSGVIPGAEVGSGQQRDRRRRWVRGYEGHFPGVLDNFMPVSSLLCVACAGLLCAAVAARSEEIPQDVTVCTAVMFIINCPRCLFN